MHDRTSQGSRRRSEANLTRDDIAQIYALFDDGRSVKEIEEFTRTELGNPKQERQLYRHKKAWKQRKAQIEKEARDSGLPQLDDPVDWVRLREVMGSLNISRETLSMIRATQGWAESTFHRAFPAHLTYRSAKWYSYVMDYEPSIQLPIDVWAIGEQYAYRERTADYFGQPMERSDLDAWLTYAPWLDDELKARYLDAIKNGVISELPNLDENSNFRLAEGQDPESDDTRWMVGRGILSAFLCRMVPEQKHLLPSLQLKYLTSTEELEGHRPLGVKFTYGNTRPIRIRLG